MAMVVTIFADKNWLAFINSFRSSLFPDSMYPICHIPVADRREGAAAGVASTSSEVHSDSSAPSSALQSAAHRRSASRDAETRWLLSGPAFDDDDST